MRRIPSPRDERAFALVLALLVLFTFSIVAITVTTYTSSNLRSSYLGQAQQSSSAVAEAGLNDAGSVLGNGANNALDPCLLHPPTDPAGVTCASHTPFSTTYANGTVSWYGVLTQSSYTYSWTVYSTATYPNPTGGLPITKSMNATYPLVSDPSQPANTTVWNYMMAWGTSDSTHCDMNVTNSVQIDAPLYVAGNLCLNNSSQVIEADSTRPVRLTVLGKLALQGSNGVGKDKDHPITQADIGGGCTSNIANASHTCNPASPTKDKFWVGTYTSNPSPLTVPVPDFAGWYQSATPGPKHPCTSTSGTPPTWDNDSTLNLATNGSTPTFELTSATSYTCETIDPITGNIIGQLDWNATTHTFTLKGATYIDGSVTISNSSTDLYNGSGTLYLTGTFTISNSARLCGATSTNCNFSTWDPSSNIWLIIAHGNDGTGHSILVGNSSNMEAGFYGTNDFDFQQSAQVEGPMIAHTIDIGQSVIVKPLPAISNLPLGAPGNPNTHASPGSPSYGGG